MCYSSNDIMQNSSVERRGHMLRHVDAAVPHKEVKCSECVSLHPKVNSGKMVLYFS